MSGHSKWHNIQARKGKADKARSNIFTKLSRLISVAAQQGGGDQEMNFSLRLAVEKAKSANMPKDNIEKAIKRGTGEDSDGVQLQEAIYEGFGPAGVAVMVECLTDNSNRTVSEVKSVFSKNNCSLGGPGSVQWQFNQLGVVRLAEEQRAKIKDKKDEFELALMDAGAEDIIDDDMGMEIRCQKENFQKILEVVQKFEIEPDESGLEWVAKETVELSDEDSERVERFYDLLDELDDVKAVYTNEA